jgi:Zn-dependent protease with chaperone function
MSVLAEAPPKRRGEDAKRVPLKGLDSRVYEHPADRSALSVLKAVPGLDRIMAWLLDTQCHGEKVQMLAQGIEVTPRSIPTLNRMYDEGIATLDLTERPKLFVVNQPVLNAWASGGDEPFVVLTSELVDTLQEDELRFVIAHELGHVKSGHVIYHNLARYLAWGAATVSQSTLGIGGLLANATLGPTLYAWCRRSEFTADRAGMLGCQDRRVALKAMARMAGAPLRFVDDLDPECLIEQVASWEREHGRSLLHRVLDVQHQLFLTHPQWVFRAAELARWIDDGEFDEIVHCDEKERRRLASFVASDARQQELVAAAMGRLRTWVIDTWKVDRLVAARTLRRMIHEGQRATETPFDAILRIEMHLEREGAAKVKPMLHVLRLDGSKVLQESMVIADPIAWESLPSSTRGEFIRGGGDRLVRVLYSVR